MGRNLDSDPFGFSLPTSRGRYFPDFIVELTDGRLAIIEYKGRSCEEKRQVGVLWAARRGARWCFRCFYLTDGGNGMVQ
jgi:type III restriction enzyme